MARDYEAEIQQANAAGDVAALTRIAYQLVAKIEHDEERRERDAKRQRDNRRNRASGTSRTSVDNRGHPRTSVDVADIQDGSPHREELELPPTPAALQRVVRDIALVDLVDDDLLRTKLVALKTHVADDALWLDVESFFLRRKPTAWHGWVDAMLRDAGPGSQFTPEDLAQVCRDDGTLEKPLGSGFILRGVFLPKARAERLKLAAGDGLPPPDGSARASPPRRAARRDTAPASTPAPPSDPDQKITWT